MSGAIPPLPYYAFMAWCSVKKKHRDNFTFTFTETQGKVLGQLLVFGSPGFCYRYRFCGLPQALQKILR
jgi:hypothetical protein